MQVGEEQGDVEVQVGEDQVARGEVAGESQVGKEQGTVEVQVGEEQGTRNREVQVGEEQGEAELRVEEGVAPVKVSYFNCNT